MDSVKAEQNKTLYTTNDNHYHFVLAYRTALFMEFLNSFFRRPLTVKLEIAPDFLASLMEHGQIHASNFHWKRIV